MNMHLMLNQIFCYLHISTANQHVIGIRIKDLWLKSTLNIMFLFNFPSNSLLSLLFFLTFLFIKSIMTLWIRNLFLFGYGIGFLVGLRMECTFFQLLLFLLFLNLSLSIIRLILPFGVTVHEVFRIVNYFIGLINLRIIDSFTCKILFIQVWLI